MRIKESSGVLTFLILDDRSKNAQSLHNLDISPDKRKDIIRKLKVEDFYRIEDGKYMEKYMMWSFGKMVQNTEVYIKISLTERNVICISFHEAEFPVTYPFK
ncbi:MAG TPA: type II toxin-antitoxin system MqsR family toxin [Paludibacteraceae bacterium]|nr:type II toxin-antitoxin system MqsR family toxin [Paludibacteraceae bacterium]